MKWNALPHNSDIILLKVYYVLTSQQNETILTTDVNVTESGVDIVNLGKFVNYTFWIRSVSRRGLGISTNPIYVRTLEEGEDEACYFFNVPQWIFFFLVPIADSIRKLHWCGIEYSIPM